MKKITNVGKKIAIVGSPGAGKSTLAQQLGEGLGIEVIHLDKYFWQAGWQETPRDVWIDFQQYLVQTKQWIIDGTYLHTSEIRLQAADTIIFLDMPRYLCLWRVIKRHYQYADRPRPDFSESCLDKLDWQYIKKVFWYFPHADRKLLIRKIFSFTEEHTSFFTLLRRGAMHCTSILGQSMFLWTMCCIPTNHVFYYLGQEGEPASKKLIRLRSRRAVKKFVQGLEKAPEEKLHVSEPALALPNN